MSVDGGEHGSYGCVAGCYRGCPHDPDFASLATTPSALKVAEAAVKKVPAERAVMYREPTGSVEERLAALEGVQDDHKSQLSQLREQRTWSSLRSWAISVFGFGLGLFAVLGLVAGIRACSVAQDTEINRRCQVLCRSCGGRALWAEAHSGAAYDECVCTSTGLDAGVFRADVERGRCR